MVLFVVAERGSLRDPADADERDVGRLSVGMEAVVRADAFPGRTFPAKVREITPQGDSAGRVFRVRLQLAADTPLKPGMTVETNLVTAVRQNAILVASTAVKDQSVWVVANGQARRRAVTTGATGGEATEIVRGLKPGETVLTERPAGLREGRRVSPKTAG
jgi:RND family efflux transporter MFP subunit